MNIREFKEFLNQFPEETEIFVLESRGSEMPLKFKGERGVDYNYDSNPFHYYQPQLVLGFE